MTYGRFANVETNLFPGLAERFQATGQLHPLELWAILKWKANRSASRHCQRLTDQCGTFAAATTGIAAAVSQDYQPSDRLHALMVQWGFRRLPTASAILCVLYPDEFPIYDYRVCNSLGRFHELAHRQFSHDLWTQYFQEFKNAILQAVPDATLREADHYLWGMSWTADASQAINVPFPAEQDLPA